MYSIAPCPVVTTKTITCFKIDRIEISLFKSAIITVILLDSTGSLLDVKFVNITGEDYSKWSDDDTYVVEFVKQSLGFSDVAKPSVIPPPPPITEITITETQTHVETPATETSTETSSETPTETPTETSTETSTETI